MKIEEIYNLGKFNLFPICRSLTGLGNLKTLKIIKNKLKFSKDYLISKEYLKNE